MILSNHAWTLLVHISIMPRSKVKVKADKLLYHAIVYKLHMKFKLCITLPEYWMWVRGCDNKFDWLDTGMRFTIHLYINIFDWSSLFFVRTLPITYLIGQKLKWGSLYIYISADLIGHSYFYNRLLIIYLIGQFTIVYTSIYNRSDWSFLSILWRLETTYLLGQTLKCDLLYIYL